MKKIALITFLVLLLDQASKIYIKTHFSINESINVFGLDWWKITFVENPGMAYGIQWWTSREIFIGNSKSFLNRRNGLPFQKMAERRRV